ncbi:MAG: glycerol-3-phosphate 1-O-acyltransferase PlsY [Gammaproteobacteria bacterium]
MIDWLLAPVAYLLGSVSSAIIVCRFMGLPDPRQQGSNNPGATNVMRIGGKKAAAITLLGDALKGLIAVLIAKFAGASADVVAMVGLLAILGHMYPIFFGFKGGKGVATGCGVFFGYSWLLGLLVASTWVTVFKLFKISSLSALVAAVLAPVYTWLVMDEPVYAGVAAVISVISIMRHKSNIQKLWAGTET